MPPTESKRNHLIDVALRLFCTEGFHATGVDRVVAEAGVAKMTLYKHFPSKEELIVSCLAHAGQALLQALEARIAAAPPDPRQRLLAAIDHFAECASSAQFQGCAFQHAAAEYADPTHPVHMAAAAPKRAVLHRLEELAGATGHPDPNGAARRLLLVIEGALALGPFGVLSDLATPTRALAEAALGD